MPEPVTAPGREARARSEAGVVRLRGVTKEGDQAPVLDGISLDVHEGEIFGLLGPAGAGTSSLLELAAGLRTAGRGSVRIFGVDPIEDRSRLAGDVAWALAPRELAERTTCRQNLELRARAGAGALSPGTALAAVGLADRAGVLVAALDGGEKRLLGIACALLTDPRLLFLDEPTVGLPPTQRERVWEVLRAQRDHGRTLVLATSSLQEAVCVCDEAGGLVDGELVAVGAPSEIADEHFPERSLRFATEDEPDRAALEDLPDVLGVRIRQEPDHWAVEVSTRQPSELLKLISADPAMPEPARVEEVEDPLPRGDR